jgi:hypothetical protein
MGSMNSLGHLRFEVTVAEAHAARTLAGLRAALAGRQGPTTAAELAAATAQRRLTERRAALAAALADAGPTTG